MTLPNFADGHVIIDDEWNAHANAINANTNDVATLIDKPHARYYQTVNQTLPDGNTDLQFDTAQDTHPDIVASGTGNQDFTLNRAGIWVITGACRFSADTGGGERYTEIRLNSAATLSFDASYPASAVASNGVSTTRRFSVGDVITIRVFQSSGGSITTEAVGFEEAIHLGLTWVGP